MDDNDHVFYSLDSEIERVQKDRIIKQKGNNSGHPTIIRLHLGRYAFIIAAILNMCFGSLTCLLLSVLGVVLAHCLDLFIETKQLLSLSRSDGYEGKIEVVDAKEYYYEEFRYQRALDMLETEDERKYEEVVKKQREGKPKPAPIQYSKDDEINLMVDMIENYFSCYKLPPLQVKDYEWDAFFDVLYDTFKRKQMKKRYFHVVSEVIRYALANVLTENKRVIHIEDFINSLTYLHGTNAYNGILPDDFSAEDVDDMKLRMERIINKHKRINQKNLAKRNNYV